MKTKEKYIPKYESIYKKLEYMTNTYLKTEKPNRIESLFLSPTEANESKLPNRLIELPSDDITSTIQENYTSISHLKGQLGTIDSADQFDGITNMALLMLMSNKVAKLYPKKCNERDKAYRYKDTAITDLIASLYVLEKTDEDYKDVFCYGNTKDTQGRAAFIIDLPYYGQIDVHYRSPENRKFITQKSKQKAISILERKQELGQISSEQLENLKNDLDQNNITPKYPNNLYEYKSGLPIEESGKQIRKLQNDLKINPYEDLSKNKLDELCTDFYSKSLNPRETYYLCVKLGFSKKQLTYINTKMRDNTWLKDSFAKKIGKSALKSTSAQERQSVKQSTSQMEAQQSTGR